MRKDWDIQHQYIFRERWQKNINSGEKSFLGTEEHANRNRKDHMFLDAVSLPDFFTKRVSQPIRADAILDFVLASNKDKSWWYKIALDSVHTSTFTLN